MKNSISINWNSDSRKVEVKGDLFRSAIMDASLEYAFVPDMSAEEERGYFGIPTLKQEIDRFCSDESYAKRQKDKPQSFVGKWEFLSNMYLSSVIIGDMVFPSAENAFQAMKCKTRAEMAEFQFITPYEAKKRGAKVELRSNWNEIRDKVMKKVLEAKFEDQELAIQLLETGDMYLCEKNWWNDEYWGKCWAWKYEDIYDDQGEYAGVRKYRKWEGENRLGKLLCEVREEIRASHIYDPYLTGYAEQADIEVDWIGKK
ncbi:MAG: NADAR family protein [Oscillospiraceae bacterium]|nr:NADAR family protein [Oscillospiraceae bacterium]